MRPPRPEYETTEFRRLWHDLSVPIKNIAAIYGVSSVSIIRAAQRRKWPSRKTL